MLAAKWHECQDVLTEATEAELAETDATYMSEKMPSFFSGSGPRGALTPNEFRALRDRIKAKKLRSATNPATLIAMGKIGGRDE